MARNKPMRIAVRRNWKDDLKKPTTEMIRRVASEVLADARRFVPVDTGELRDSLDMEVIGTSARVGTNNDYAVYVEKGTSKMKAQPYLRPAAYKKRSL